MISDFLSETISRLSIGQNCNHQSFKQFGDDKFCALCGIRLQQDSTVYKSMHFKSVHQVNPLVLQKNQVKSINNEIINEMPASYENDRNYLLDYMLECTSKLKLSFNTYHLAVYYLDSYVINRKKQMDLFCYKVFAATSLMLAAKAIEFDQKIPFISKLKKYCQLEVSTKDIKYVENRLLSHLNWDLQKCTLLDLVESLLCQGIVFSSDQIHEMKKSLRLGNDEEKKELKLVEISEKIEQDYIRVTNMMIRDVESLRQSKYMSALGCVLYLRKMNNLFPVLQVQNQKYLIYQALKYADELVTLFEKMVIKLDPVFLVRDKTYHYQTKTKSNISSPIQQRENTITSIQYTSSKQDPYQQYNLTTRKPLQTIGNTLKLTKQQGQPQSALRFGSTFVYLN